MNKFGTNFGKSNTKLFLNNEMHSSNSPKFGLVFEWCKQIVGKLSTKSKQKQRKPSAFILMKICFLTKRKKEHRQIYDKKPKSLQRNGMAAIPKIIFQPMFKITDYYRASE